MDDDGGGETCNSVDGHSRFVAQTRSLHGGVHIHAPKAGIAPLVLMVFAVSLILVAIFKAEVILSSGGDTSASPATSAPSNALAGQRWARLPEWAGSEISDEMVALPDPVRVQAYLPIECAGNRRPALLTLHSVESKNGDDLKSVVGQVAYRHLLKIAPNAGSVELFQPDDYLYSAPDGRLYTVAHVVAIVRGESWPACGGQGALGVVVANCGDHFEVFGALGTIGGKLSSGRLLTRRMIDDVLQRAQPGQCIIDS